MTPDHNPAHKLATCSVCHQQHPAAQMSSWYEVRPSLSRLIAADVPGWDETGYICRGDLMTYRQRLLNALLSDEEGELGAMEARVATALAKGDLLTPETLEEPEATRFGERMADRVGRRAGVDPPDLLPPPLELGLRQGQVVAFVDHVVHLAAEGVQRGDRLPALGWQEHEAVIGVVSENGE